MTDQQLDGRLIEATQRVELSELEWLLRQKRLTPSQREKAVDILRRRVVEPAARAVVDRIESDPALLAKMRQDAQRRRYRRR